jgi:ABC-2 type transport system ATP-binding protein
MMSVIEVENLSKNYGATRAVDGVSFTVNEGEIFGLLGPNGAGKTTTMECVEGIRKPDAGVLSIFDLDPIRDATSLHDRLGVQLQEAQLQKRIKVGEAVALWATLYSNPVDIDRLLDQLGLTEKRDTWFMNLSGGQKQRLSIALALIHDPDVVFLDELTTGLDPQARRTIWELVLDIKNRGKTVFLTTHLMEEAEQLCDRVAIIEHGKIIAMDTPSSLVRDHCPVQSVVFTVEGELNPSPFESIVEGISVDESSGEIRLNGVGDDFVSKVIHTVAAQDLNVLNFRTVTPSLEDVYLKLTGHTIRD